MYKFFYAVIILALLIGCSKVEPILTEKDIQGITYSYSEHVFINAMFITYVISTLSEDAHKPTSVESLRMYIEGFERANKRRDIYKSVEKIVYNSLSNKYNDQIVKEIDEAYKKLNVISNYLSEYMMKNNTYSSEFMKNITNLRENIKNLLPKIYPQNDNKDITLYNLIAHPEDVVEEYSKEQIEQFLTTLNSSMDHLLNIQEKYKTEKK
ncbi:hypothetical protein O3V59_17970 [Brevibacillus thermoruber]|jgi:hypothetical protein|uniref:Lipoprotein n=1 Tax=Brevibacillus thermoruber TaxID=33942 RepID=A0A9X3TUW2_9BACL|nr:hypothetical protein [Brevibacillus thermoruber]MDA5110258.1 hypothetical protein [Brevibacillus thermoruber]